MTTGLDDTSDPPRLAFSLGDLIGVQGGIGRYAAKQEGIDRQVFADVLMSQEPDACANYVKHVQALGSLSHPVVPRIHAFGRLRDGRLALVHQFRHGVPWSDLLNDRHHPHWWTFTGRSQVGVTNSDRLEVHLRVIVAVCHGLQHARDYHLAHGYLVPANVILGELGDVQVIGWEHAIHDDALAMAGDMVALGAVLAELATDAELRDIAEWTRSNAEATPLALRLRILTYLGATDSHVLCRDAQELLATLRVMGEPADGDTGDVGSTDTPDSQRRPRRLIELRVKTLFSMAKLIHPGHPEATAGLLAYHRLMTSRALGRGDVLAADHHLSAQSDPDHRQQAALEKLVAKAERLSNQGSEFEEMLSGAELAQRYRIRSTLVVIVGGLLGLSQVGIGLLDAANVIRANHRMYAVLMGMSALALYLTSRRTRFAEVFTNDRRARTVRAILVAAMGFPALFWIVLEASGVPFRASLTLTLAETGVIIAMASAALHGPLIWLAALVLLASLVSALLPGYEFEMLGAATFISVIWVGFVWTYRIDAIGATTRTRGRA